ncbi:MAG: HNH endonuclease [Kiritimatiellia bacterium]|jgi:putative restriction endonuclease
MIKKGFGVSHRPWTREEVLLAINLYCKTPYARLNQIYPEVKALAKLIDRTPSAVSMRCCNYASFDPVESQRVKGLVHASKGDKKIWDEVLEDWEAFILESERLLAERQHAAGASAEDMPPTQETNLNLPHSSDEKECFPQGDEKTCPARIRVGQQFFRKAVLTAYENRCCVSGLNHEALLVASHIKPWRDSDPKTERANPRNGLCLSALYDRAFDAGLMTLDDSLHVIFSSTLREHITRKVYSRFFAPYDGKKLQHPSVRFQPSATFLSYHREHIFEHQELSHELD